ncbi:hypothetical protein DYB37_005902 [Aphanomyces astaci]|uniref:Isochorismatase-like domain-containing protein n=1 Tax=Aphanomyces astaci TaxID=112090 RepID=A0A397CTX3_APHAT|nr:hypothetical protein DYB25_009221 [Aphanomyces astaci]RHY07923.1 hypothetical protein DYB36_005004 [Aphanomyces astaci]RHY46139.1 hypothetical protein DYB34_005782 [Aphanomyces astaci]RHY51076.1 hypothetical protein DYB30_008903 [Aphanomyces astaci]RHY52384.1 hypothetical protein DYB38_002639 [Aphanomyces astaci]
MPIDLPKANTALIVIDVQEGFRQPPYSDLERSTPEFESNVESLIAAFRDNGLPIVHIHHHSTSPDSPFHPTNNPTGVQPQSFAEPVDGEHVLIKHVNSSFIGTTLEQLLHTNKWNVLVVAGLTTSHCVSTTVRMAGNLGFTVFLPCDATAMFEHTTAPGSKLQTLNFDAETVQEISLGVLHNEFATVLETVDVLAALSP